MRKKKELKSIKLLMNFLNLKESHKGEFALSKREFALAKEQMLINYNFNIFLKI